MKGPLWNKQWYIGALNWMLRREGNIMHGCIIKCCVLSPKCISDVTYDSLPLSKQENLVHQENWHLNITHSQLNITHSLLSEKCQNMIVAFLFMKQELIYMNQPIILTRKYVEFSIHPWYLTSVESVSCISVLKKYPMTSDNFKLVYMPFSEVHQSITIATNAPLVIFAISVSYNGLYRRWFIIYTYPILYTGGSEVLYKPQPPVLVN